MRNALYISAFILLGVLGLLWIVSNREPYTHSTHISQSSIPENLQIEGPPSATTAAFTRRFPMIEGTLVCSDSETVGQVIHLYERAWQEQFEVKMTRGQSKLIHGEPMAQPHPEDYGCILLQPGTQVLLETGNIVPVVFVHLDNSWARGVTYSDMLYVPAKQLSTGELESISEKNNAAVKAASDATNAKYKASSSWTPESNTAQAITGTIGFSISGISIAGQTFPLTLYSSISESEIGNAYKLFSEEVPSRMDSFLFKTAIPIGAKMLNGNTLCDPSETTWIIALVSYDNQQSPRHLDIAYFSGNKPPDLNPAAISESTNFCGTFSYQKMPSF